MKIKAYQRPPEYQISPLIQFDEIDENVSIYGNPRYNERKSNLFRNLPGILDEIAEELQYLKQGYKPYSDFADVLEAHTGRDNYTRAERKKWADIIRRWEETDEETGVLLDALRLITGIEYAHSTLWGCCQGDWQYIIYPAEYGEKWREAFEIEYFNLGSEWTIQEGEGDEYSIYCTTTDHRAEISHIVGCDPADVEIYLFDGWERTPKYKGALS